MRRWLAQGLRRVADWLDPAPDRGPLVTRARVLCDLEDAIRGPGFGEAKRHQVYARLLKDFPEVPKRAIARAIEDALDAR